MGNYTPEEGIQDGMQLIGISKNVYAAFKTLPPKEVRKLKDYAVALHVPPESELYQILALIDQIEEHAAD